MSIRFVVNQYRLSRLLVSGLVLAAVILLVNLGIIFFIQEGNFKTVLIDLGFPLWYVLAAMGLFYAAYRARLHSRRLALAWAVMGMAELSLGVGASIWVNLEISAPSLPFPSLADLFYIAFYPLFLLGILLLSGQRITRLEWLKTGLDMLIVLLVATLILWYYWLGPLIAAVHNDNFALQFVSLAYPVGDLVLFSGLLLLLYRQATAQVAIPLFLLAAGIVFMIASDFNYGYQGLFGTTASAAWLDVGWVLSGLSHGVAGLWQATRIQPVKLPATNTAVSSRLNIWLTHLPYAWILGAYFILDMNQRSGELGAMLLLSSSVELIIGLVLIRQVVTLWENRRQAQILNQTNQALYVEIGERQRAEEQLSHDALHDALTGLPNRVLFLDRLRHAIEFAKRHEGYRFATLFLDIDHFKVVNDSLGHALGDQLLIGIAQRLRLCLRPGDTVARLSGDEFVMLLEDTKDEQEATTTATRIQTQLKQPFSLSGHQHFASASVGIVSADQGYDQAEDVLRDADLAMYQAKTHGKARHEVFKITMREQVPTRLELENDLRYALERQELALHYQPIVALPSEQITGFEALLRWHHPQRGLIAPLEFIPMAEETGLIVPIGKWVLSEACRQLQTWQVRFPQTPPLTMSVNISGKQFPEPDFIDQVQRIVRTVGLDPTTLRLELTESVWLNSSPEALALFRQLSHMGIQLHMDDFGTGYSSLAYLQHFPIRMLKIDHTFLKKMDDDSKNKEIIRAVIAMAHDLGMETVAEGVETVEQLDQLKQMGCNYGQGYLLNRPITQAAIEQLLNEQRLKPARLPQPTAALQLAGQLRS